MAESAALLAVYEVITMKYYFIVLATLSVLALILYGADKLRAKRDRWRIPEAILLGLGFFGGAVGALLGMKLWHHKTKHWYFWVVNVLGLVWQLALAGYLLFAK